MASDLLATVDVTSRPRSEGEDASGAGNGVSKTSLSSAPVRGRLRWGALWVILGRSSGIGVTMLVNMLLARWLAPQELGDFLLLSSVLALASLLAMLGLNTAVVRFVSESMGRGDMAAARQSMGLVLAVAAFAIAGVAALASLCLATFDSTLLGLPAVPGLVPLAVTSLVLLALLQLIAEACRSMHELRLATLFSGGQTGGLLSNIVFLMLIAAAMVLGRPSYFTAVALNLVAMAISLPLAVLGLSRTVRDRFRLVPRPESTTPLSVATLLAYSLPVLAIQLLTFVTTQGDLWIAGIWCPHDELALYGAARRLTLIIAMPLQMLNFTVISSIAELYGQQRRQDLQRLLRGAASLAAWPSVVAIVLLLVAGGPILELFFGPYFRQAALPLGILAVGQLFLSCAGSASCALTITGHQTGPLAINLITAFALASIGTWAARHFGIVGVAVTSSGVFIAQSISLWLLAKRYLGVWTHPTLLPTWNVN
jgi:O-antigen/teichoic acid export membrane protein